MKLSELQPKQSGVDVEVEVVDLGEVREFTKFGRVGRVCTAVVKDDSAQMNMTLWNDDIDKVKVGDMIKLTDGFVNEWQGEMQLTTGRAGKMEVIEGQAKLAESKTTKSEEPDEPAAEAAEEPAPSVEAAVEETATEEPAEEPAPSVEAEESKKTKAPEKVKEEDVDVEEEFIE